jgi:hypothetical protein
MTSLDSPINAEAPRDFKEARYPAKPDVFSKELKLGSALDG